MIRMVIFDMAGTTVDEGNVVYKTLQDALNKKGLSISLDQVLAEGAGKEKLDAVKSILKVYGGNLAQTLAEEVFADFRLQLSSAYETQPVLPQPHAEEIFRELMDRNIRIVLNTGYDSETAEVLVRKLGWKKGKEFDSLITASDVEHGRPDPEMINLAMDIYGVLNPKDVVKVGDSIIDIEEGQNAACGLTIGITTGAHSYQQLQSANPDHIINDLMELLPIVDAYKSY